MTASRAALGCLLPVAMLGCAAGGRGGAHPPLATTSGGECVPLGAIDGTGIGGSRVTREIMISRATREALEKAKAMGATHVVLDHELDHATEVTLSGFAYRCR
jgi:hypothetical protein